MNTIEWLYTSISEKRIPTEDILTELYHRVQIEELPLIVYTKSNKWFVTLDERSIGKGDFGGFHFYKPFSNMIAAVTWARNQFGTGKDINVSVVNGIIKPKICD